MRRHSNDVHSGEIRAFLHRLLRMIYDDLQGFFGRVAGQGDGIGGLFQREPVGDEGADVQFPRENEVGDFVLNGKIGGIAANEVFFVQANGGVVKLHARIIMFFPVTLTRFRCRGTTLSRSRGRGRSGRGSLCMGK